MPSTNQPISTEDETESFRDYFDGGVAEAIVGSANLSRLVEQIAKKRRAYARHRATLSKTDADQWQEEKGKVQELNWWADLVSNAQTHIENKRPKK